MKTSLIVKKSCTILNFGTERSAAETARGSALPGHHLLLVDGRAVTDAFEVGAAIVGILAARHCKEIGRVRYRLEDRG